VNQAPVLGAITLSTTDPIQKGMALNLSSSFTDGDQPQSTPYAYSINWGDGSTPTSQTGILSPGSINASHTYSVSGVFTVTVSVTDKINSTASGASVGTYQYVVVYDPGAGFVTGGGWIVAANGSCVATNAPSGVCTNATGGRANFGFVSKYQKGATTPSGDTEFQFQAGNLNFKSTSYQWLVISGPQAQYKGKGTINGGSTVYDFILTAVDGSQPGGGGVDKFRIKIMNGTLVVFDNQQGADDTDAPTTALGGGSISIKSK
jgi:hypothetical protein